MSEPLSRREAIKALGAASASIALGPEIIRGLSADIIIAGKPVEIEVASLSAATVRLAIRPIEGARAIPVPDTGELVKDAAGKTSARERTPSALGRVRAGDLVVKFTESPPAITIETAKGERVQHLTFDAAGPGMSFLLGAGPLLGLGEGGPQFDRKGATDKMIIGQGGYHLATHGTRAPIQWLVGTDGWAMFIHQPYGAFDLTGTEGKFIPPADLALPLQLFVVSSRDPKVIMREYARLTGFAEFPARWTLGYQQSHRTLAGAEEVMSIARTMREKRLPCDALIYLGTEFTPSGWNTRNGEFTWHPVNFPDPKKMLDELHAEHFRVVLHIVVEGHHLSGGVSDACTAAPLPSGRTPDNKWPPDRQVSCYWPFHKPLMDVGVDGWWPDQGDGFDGPSELNRHRMYWEGTQLYHPNERPYALHRNASAGVQRFGGFIWSGDIQSRWETLKNHVPIALNTGLSGLPYWGTDIGGFYPTADYTGELFVRWFQFAAFSPLFRSHGRNWHLHLPWGWDGGDGGPSEVNNYTADPTELHNKQVEPICRKYLELRYQLMPYLYTAVRDCHETGMPVMRAMWLHHPDDPAATARGDQYYWGADMLVAPVVGKGATARNLYLPRGIWFEYWSERRVDGGREVEHPVDLGTMPLYVRGGATLPMGPVKQYTSEPSDLPVALTVYPGADGESTWYEDDGISFRHRRGEFMRIAMAWNDGARTLALRLARGSKMIGGPRRLAVRVAGSANVVQVQFVGDPVEITL
jgi:alpha-glucosidase/alpha-D-xyloside xylohydrolase